MKNRKLSSLLLLVLVASLAAGTGCLPGEGIFGETYYVESEPPPPRQTVVVQRPGYTWTEGYWHRTDGRWGWIDGSYTQERRDSVYVQGGWVAQGHGWKYSTGHWKAREEHEQGHHGR